MGTCPARLAAVLAAAIFATSVGAQWGPTLTANTPAERSGALMSYDLFGARMLMFGGNGTNEFWSLQNGAWTHLQPGVMPSARMHAALATDTFAGTVLLYGGTDGNRIANDETWLWNGTVWTQLSPAQTPGGLTKHVMAFDIARQRTVLVGGMHDTWTPHNLNWTTWEFDGTNWAPATPSTSPLARTRAGFAFQPAVQKLVMFGGDDSNGVSLDDTWIFDGDWAQVNPALPHPAARGGTHMETVLTSNRCVLLGGQDATTLQIFNDTWDFDGAQWRQDPSIYGGIYPARHDFAMAHDVLQDRLVAFGGAIANGALQNDTWEYGAQFQRFGNGCPGSAGIPSLHGTSLPRIGLTCTAQIDNLPATSTFALMAAGLSRTTWALGSLPSLLTNFGMPGCRSYTSADVFTVIGASNGSATWTWNVPMVPEFVGQAFYLQGLSIDPGINAAGLVVSNAAVVVVGI